MISFNIDTARHKAQVYRLLTAMLDEPAVSQPLVFKGGTCAAMSGFLDRFSVDLDFDLVDPSQKESLRKMLHQLFVASGFKIEQESKNALQFFLKYDAPANNRNTLKLEITDVIFETTETEFRYLADIKRNVCCHKRDSMFAHKLVAITDRYKAHKNIAARDLYDIHHFFMQGYTYNGSIIIERTGLDVKEYLHELKGFIQKKITQKIIDQDLNFLFPIERFRIIRRVIKDETIWFLDNELTRLGG